MNPPPPPFLGPLPGSEWHRKLAEAGFVVLFTSWTHVVHPRERRPT